MKRGPARMESSAFTRLIPLFSLNLLNYAFGLTKIKFLHYACDLYLHAAGMYCIHSLLKLSFRRNQGKNLSSIIIGCIGARGIDYTHPLPREAK